MDTETLSTTLETDPMHGGAGGGMPKIAEPEAIPTARDALDAALKEDDAKQAEPPKQAKEEKAEKVADAAKGEPKPEGKDEKPDDKEVKADDSKADEQPKGDEKAVEQTDDKGDGQPQDKAPKGKHHEAPANFLPAAKDMWRNTPNAVRSEVHRVMAEAEAATEQYKRYDDIRPFDELAKSNGRDLRESLVKLNQIENLMQTNPLAGLNAILQEIGPRKQDGQPYSLFEVAQYIGQQGAQGYNDAMTRGQQVQQQQAGQAQVEALQARIQQMEVEAAARDIIEPFRAANPRYDELQDDIAFFLQSGKIPTSLDGPERLAAAYDMAVRINPSSHVPAASDAQAATRRADDFGGSAKSIKSSPGSVTEEVEDQAPSGESILDSITKAGRRLGMT